MEMEWSRREFMAAALSVPALAAAVSAADEAAKPAKAAAPDALEAIAAAARHCVETGLACHRHCERMLKSGDTSMKDCFDANENMLAACEAMSKLASYGSASEDSLKAMARACAKFCRACEAECAKHSKEHQVCADCQQSCAACARACEAFA